MAEIGRCAARFGGGGGGGVGFIVKPLLVSISPALSHKHLRAMPGSAQQSLVAFGLDGREAGQPRNGMRARIRERRHRESSAGTSYLHMHTDGVRREGLK